MKKIMTMLAVISFVFVSGLTMQAGAEQGAKSKKPCEASHHDEKCATKPMHFYMDTHDKTKGTFPAGLTPEQFEVFYGAYKKAMFEEGVIPIRVHVAYEDGRAFCLSMAPDIESVKRAHEKLGLPYDSITEVFMATPGDTFFKAQP
jgi:hypothetical protein